MEWAEFFFINGEDPLLASDITIEELYEHFENRFAATNVVNSIELLEPAEIEPID